MKNKKIFLFTILCLITLFYSVDAYAGILDDTATKLTSTFKSIKSIIFVIGGFGLVGIAYWAFFGKVKWSWLAGLLVGLAVLSAAGAFLLYATETKIGSGAAIGDDGTIFGFLKAHAITFAVGLRNIAFCLAGFGIIMFTFLAISGKINFKHLGYIFISLFLLAGVGMFISYWSGADGSDLGKLYGFSNPKTFADSLGDTFSANSSFGE